MMTAPSPTGEPAAAEKGGILLDDPSTWPPTARAYLQRHYGGQWGESPARERLLREIASTGPLTCARFMEIALYDPECGYYARGGARRVSPGPTPDYVTSPETHPAFGQLLGRGIARILREIGGDGATVCEVGAGSGAMALGILQQLSAEGLGSVRYLIAEPLECWRERQRETLQDYLGRVRWVDALADLPPSSVRGVIVSNELLDAMPVHRVVSRAGELRELFVSAAGDSLAEEEGEPSTPELGEYFRRLDIQPLPERPVEVNLRALEWLKDAARVLRSGCVLTLDYGCSAEDLYLDSERAGTLRAYHRQSSNRDWLERPGEQDLTSDVDFTSLRVVGREFGLETCRFETQREYLLRLGWREYLGDRSRVPGRNLDLARLVDPETQGRVRVLEQRRLEDG